MPFGVGEKKMKKMNPPSEPVVCSMIETFGGLERSAESRWTSTDSFRRAARTPISLSQPRSIESSVDRRQMSRLALRRNTALNTGDTSRACQSRGSASDEGSAEEVGALLQLGVVFQCLSESGRTETAFVHVELLDPGGCAGEELEEEKSL
ncbi:hypothetical protein Q8A67_024089 [Cirrhinus molitorella]|uniref:Uncharacterized protein n=1 Tax=Cirrhinus molitorella TaxID=172907 RepID=A0AA88P3T6_9TELE|nr:hypothetical protein Q8A67_024089 [Cirrhinus molitorella]